MENKQNVQNQNFSKIPLKEKKVNKKQNSRTKPFQQKPGEEAHNKMDFQKWATNARGGNQHAKQNNSWLCGMGGIWCHAMLCIHVVDSRRCPVHGEHGNSSSESSASDKKRWSTRSERQGCGPSFCFSDFSFFFYFFPPFFGFFPSSRAFPRDIFKNVRFQMEEM